MTDARPAIPGVRHVERLDRAQAMLERDGVSALLIGVGADLRYLTGYEAMPLERLTMLVLPARGSPTLVAPRLEAMAAAGSPAARLEAVQVAPWDETDDAHGLVASLLASGTGHQIG
ncbi:MAG: aminopeptidase P family protein, partial [Chloroflexota bacterium]